MCEPTTITMGVMAVLSAGAAMYSANQQKHAIEDQLKVQQKQTDEAASAQTEDRIKAMREQRAAARAAAAESGIGGNAMASVLNDIAFQSGRDVSRIEKNRQNGTLQANQQARSASAEVNGNLIQGLTSAGKSAVGAYGAWSAYRDSDKYIPRIPNAGQHNTPRITVTPDKYIIPNIAPTRN